MISISYLALSNNKMPEPQHHILFATCAGGEELIGKKTNRKKNPEKLSLTHNKFKTLLLPMQKHGEMSVIFFRGNHSQLCSLEVNP